MLTVDEMAQVSLMMQEALANHMPIGRHGMVVPGSYNPATATVDVLICDASIVFPGDQQTQPMVEQSVPLATTHIDDTHGPFGGEPCFLASVQGGYVAHIHRTPTPGVDSSNVPAGERWILLRNPAGAVISHVKITQNGAANDGLGGMDMLAGSRYQMASAGGHTMLFDDAGKIASIVSAGGIVSKMDDNLNRLTHQAGAVYALFDGAGNMITHIANGINLGALSTAMTSANAALNQSHLTAFESNMFTKRLDDLTKFAAAMVAAGVPNAGSVIGLLATLLHIPVPNGSSIVKLAS